MAEPYVTPRHVEMWGPNLDLLMRWADVIACARELCIEANTSNAYPVAPVRISVVKIELEYDHAVFLFERRISVPNGAQQKFSNLHALTRDLVDSALLPSVWQHPMRRCVQQLVAEVPTFGYAELPDHLKEKP